MKCRLIIFFLILSGCAVSQTVPRWKIDSLKRYESEAVGLSVINFWATFCKPCVEEIPHFMDLADRFRPEGVKLLLVSLDLPEVYPNKLKRFVKSKKYRYPVVWLDESDADYFLPQVDSGWAGSIPATLILNPKTGYRKFIESPLSGAALEGEIREALKLSGP